MNSSQIVITTIALLAVLGLGALVWRRLADKRRPPPPTEPASKPTWRDSQYDPDTQSGRI